MPQSLEELRELERKAEDLLEIGDAERALQVSAHFADPTHDAGICG